MNALRTITVTALGLGVLALAAPRTATAQTSPEKNLVEVATAAGSFETLLAADIHTSNGVIHVIDAVILPPEK